MAATYVFGSSCFNSDGTAKNNLLNAPPMGLGGAVAIDTLPTTQLDDIGDFQGAIPVPYGKRILELFLDSPPDMDSGAAALDLDIVLRTTDKLGTHTDTILFDSSVAAAQFFGTAQSSRTIILGSVGSPGVTVPDDADSMGVIGYKVNTVAATAVAGTMKLRAIWV